MIKEIASKTKQFAIFYFPVVLMGIMSIGLAFTSIADAVNNMWLKLFFAVLSLPFFGVGLYFAIRILIEIAKSLDKDEKRDSSKSTTKKSRSS